VASRLKVAVMKRSRFTDEQIVRFLQEADRDPVAQVADRSAGREPSIYAWRKKFADIGMDEGRRFKQLDQENSRLKKIVSERDLEIDVMKEVTPRLLLREDFIKSKKVNKINE
jgi:putative transposase